MSDNKNIHICLVSAQILANLIPVLMDQPDRIVLISTDTMKNNGMLKRFKDILDAKNLAYDVFEEMPSTGMPAIYDYALSTSAIIQERYPNAKLVLNATGGTKLMSQGFIEVMEDDTQIIYTDTQHNRLEYLGQDKIDAIELEGVLDIKTYLKANGANYKQALSDQQDWLETIQQRKQMTKYLAKNITQIDGLIGALNYLSHKALDEDKNKGLVLAKPTQNLKREPRKDWAKALNKLAEAGLLKWSKGTEITFLDVDKTRYIGGIWLEEYVYVVAKDGNPDDIASGVKISWDNSQKTHNELDLVMVHNNRMLIIECKTMRFGRDKQKDSDVLYKVDSLGDDLKGLYGDIWLVNARDSHSGMRDRAKDRRITIIEPSDLTKLRDKFRQWMQLS